jgi:hypothetical protein
MRSLATIVVVMAAGSAFAENYTAAVYSVPTGYVRMFVEGAGDNAMMTGVAFGASGEEHAVYRTSTGFKILHPSGWLLSRIEESWGSTYHSGYGAPPGGNLRALFWVGGGAPVNLHPAGAEYSSSYAFGGGGQLQVGKVDGNINCAECGVTTSEHACVWSRTAASFKRLHTLTHKETKAWGTDGTKIVGSGLHRGDGSLNALLWNSATSMGINIRPSGSTGSLAYCVGGNQQGGFYTSAATGGSLHACLWTGTAASALDLNPNGTFQSSYIRAVRAGLQVGFASPISNPNRNQAIAWHGSAASWINLHARLPAIYQTWGSVAEGIDNLGNVVGYVSSPEGGEIRPCVWRRS